MVEVIHKLNITAEAVFDICESLGLVSFDKHVLKAETEEYIMHQARSGRLPWWGYFRCDYVDEDSGERLKLFIYKGIKIGLMQYWDLKGVSFAMDWSEDAEYDGIIRLWLETKIENLPEQDDWVVRVRVNQIINETEKTLFVNVLEEVASGFKFKRDKEAAEKLAFLQSIHFERSERKRIVKKVKRD